jgi:predicted acetyltransferase
MKLTEPSAEWEAAYRAVFEEFRERKEELPWRWNPEEQSFAEFVRRLQDFAQGENLPKGWVPASCYWLVDEDGRILGEVDIRHRLTPALEDFGGHVGYWIRPCERGKGYGTRMLALALEEARALGLTRVLITCAPENAASVRVIEKNGGVFASRSVAYTGRMTSRYWIELAPRT